MRKRSVGINVRVSVTEKRKMTLMAKRCGLSLSEYLRQRALGYEPGGHPPKEVFDVLDKIDEIVVTALGIKRDRKALARLQKTVNRVQVLKLQPVQMK